MKIYILMLFVIIPTSLATYCVENKFQGAYNISEPCFINNTHICLEDKYLYEDRFCSLYFIGYETVVHKASNSCLANIHIKLNNISQDIFFPINKNIIDKRPIFVNETIYVNNCTEEEQIQCEPCQEKIVYLNNFEECKSQIPERIFDNIILWLIIFVLTILLLISLFGRNNPKK